MWFLDSVSSAFPRLALAAFWIWLARWVFARAFPYNLRRELSEADNPAFATMYGGYLFGAAVAMCGAFDGANGQWSHDLLSLSLGGLAVVVLLPLSSWATDRVILRKFKVDVEITRDHNVGVGFVAAGVAIATGLVLEGVLTGHSEGITLFARDVLIYWLTGLLLLCLGGALFQLATPFDIHERIERDDNAAIGLAFAGFLVAEGLIVRASLHGASSDLWAELVQVMQWGLIGLLMLTAVALLVHKLFLPKIAVTEELVRDRNVGVGAVLAVAFVMASMLTIAALKSAPSTDDRATPAVQAEDHGDAVEMPAPVTAETPQEAQ